MQRRIDRVTCVELVTELELLIASRAAVVTAQVAECDRAYVALMRARREPGPNGETSIAEIWETRDRGTTWRALPWRRAARSFISQAAFARWPPEWVNAMWLTDAGLEIEVREDMGWGRSDDRIWRATWRGDRWRVRFDRHYRSEVDGLIVPASVELDLPGISAPPTFLGA